MNDEEKELTFAIPANYNESGKVLNGMFELRNLIEAIIVGAVFGFPIIKLFPFSITTKIILFVAIVIPLVIINLVGIDGNPLSQFFINMIKFRKNKRALHMKRVGYEYDPNDLKFVEKTNKQEKTNPKASKTQ